jgi:GT2 family glycosyltransferase
VQLSIIIVNYNLSQEIRKCLHSILEQINSDNATDFEIIVIDNNSPDRSIETLSDEFLTNYSNYVHFYFLNENKGFGTGNNFGVRKSKGEFLLFLNPDTLFSNNTLKNLFELISKKFSFDIIGLKIIEPDGTPEISFGQFPNILSETLSLFNLSSYFKKRAYFNKIKHSENRMVEVDWVTGSAILIRKGLFNSVGGFDENFFMYNEEVDLCERIKEKGGKIYFYKDAIIIHAGSLSSKKNYYFFTKTSYESKLYYIKKHYRGFRFGFLLLLFFLQVFTQLVFWMIMMPFTKLKALGKVKGFWEVLIALLRSKR